ncbi:MAG TPA: tetratricopeptide repeat protein [Terriglobales bacterium]|nr:tetratricopeptide repeat protein [Terriglobales bacterium]
MQMNESTETPDPTWRPVQAYGLAAICFFIGLPFGYFIHTSAPVSASASPVQAVQASASPAMPSLEQMKQVAGQQAAPIVAKLKADPNDPKLLIQAANVYMGTHQFKEAVPYFQKALQSDPRNFAVRADLASCLYYTGDSDGALAELQKTLSYDPNHAGTLLNVGIIKWKGKNDPEGAISAWQKLLKTNPKFERRDQVEHLIEMVKQDRPN